MQGIVLKEVQASDGSGPVFEVNWLEWGCFVLTPSGVFPKDGVKHNLGFEAKLDEKIMAADGSNCADIRKNWVSSMAALRYKKWNVSLLAFFTDEEKRAITKAEQAVAEDLGAIVAKVEHSRLAGGDCGSDCDDEDMGEAGGAPKVSPSKALPAATAQPKPPAGKKRRVVRCI